MIEIKDKKALSKAVKATSSDDFTATETEQNKEAILVFDVPSKNTGKRHKHGMRAKEIVNKNNGDFDTCVRVEKSDSLGNKLFWGIRYRDKRGNSATD